MALVTVAEDCRDSFFVLLVFGCCTVFVPVPLVAEEEGLVSGSVTLVVALGAADAAAALVAVFAVVEHGRVVVVVVVVVVTAWSAR
jgi:hypothetical protein